MRLYESDNSKHNRMNSSLGQDKIPHNIQRDITSHRTINS